MRNLVERLTEVELSVAVGPQHGRVTLSPFYLTGIGGRYAFFFESPDDCRRIWDQVEVLFRAHSKGKRSQELNGLLGDFHHFYFVIRISRPPAAMTPSPIRISERLTDLI